MLAGSKPTGLHTPAASLLWWCLAGLVLFWSAQPAQAEVDGIWKVYLYGNGVKDLAARGEEVWGATTGGVFRYTEGSGFVHWNRTAGGLLSDSVAAASVDAGGRVWFGTERAGISVLEPNRMRWRAFTSLLEPIPGDRVQQVRYAGPADMESLLVATAQGYALFVNEELRGVCLEGVDLCGLASYDVRDLLGRNGDLWLATAGGISVLTSDGEWEDRTAGLAGQEIRILARADSLYAAGPQGIWTWDGDSWSLAAGYGSQLPQGFSCRDLLADGNDLLAAGTGGVFRRSQGAWTQVGTDSPKKATCLVRTESGRLFAGAMDDFELDDGLWEFDGASWTQHRMDGPSQRMDLLSLAFDSEGSLWISSRPRPWVAHVARLREGEWTFFNAGSEGRLNAWTFDIREAGGSIWLAHCCCTQDQTLCRMEEVTEDGAVFEAKPVANALDLDVDAQGYLWVGTSGASEDYSHGVYRIDPETGGTLQFTPANEPNMVSGVIRSVKVIGRQVWIGYFQQGVSRWDLGPDLEPQTGDDTWARFVEGDDSTDLLGENITCIEPAADGKVWIGSTAGLSIYDGLRFTKVGSGFGRLPTPEVNAVIPTEDGGAWVATSEGGLTRMTRRTTGGFNYEFLGPPNLPNPNITAMSLSPDGQTLWLATSRGLASFLPLEGGSADIGDEIGAAPNPFHPACVDGLRLVNTGGAARGVIVDLSGKVVARFESSLVDGRGRTGVIWDGRSEGEMVPPGLYWIRAQTPRGTESVGVAVMDGGCDN